MEIIETKTPIFLFEMSELKDEVLTAINTMDRYSIIDKVQQISNSDWHLGSEYLRPYFQIIAEQVSSFCDEVSKKTESKELVIKNYWFQQYENGDYHSWHNHGDSAYSSVYYVELPDSSIATTFRTMGQEFQIKVSEGDLLIFPSYFSHCSKPNKTGKRKTIVSINLGIKN
jgi:hypothetical protein